MKYLLMNLDVGSAIEYVGNVIKKWILENLLPNDIFQEYKDQTKESSTIDYIINYNPDIIIINETYPRITSPVYYYKKFNPKSKIILFAHSQKCFIEPSDPNFKNQYMMLFDLALLCDKIFILDNMPCDIKNIKNNISIKFCPSEPEIFNNFIKWGERKKDFCYIGNIYNLKILEEFFNKIINTNIQIDMYGKLMEKFTESENYWNIFNRACEKNINYLGELKQEEVGKVFNQYKYFIYPHSIDNGESFGMTLQQSIMCGTIPIMLYDETKNDWAWWANNLFYSDNNIDSYIKGLLWIKNNNINEEYNSIFISEEIKKRQNYESFKKEFQKYLTK